MTSLPLPPSITLFSSKTFIFSSSRRFRTLPPDQMRTTSRSDRRSLHILNDFRFPRWCANWMTICLFGARLWVAGNEMCASTKATTSWEFDLIFAPLPVTRSPLGREFFFGPVFVQSFTGEHILLISFIAFWFLLRLRSHSWVCDRTDDVVEWTFSYSPFACGKINPNCDWTAFVAMNPRVSWVMKLLSGFHFRVVSNLTKFSFNFPLFWSFTMIYVFHSDTDCKLMQNIRDSVAKRDNKSSHAQFWPQLESCFGFSLNFAWTLTVESRFRYFASDRFGMWAATVRLVLFLRLANENTIY